MVGRVTFKLGAEDMTDHYVVCARRFRGSLIMGLQASHVVSLGKTPLPHTAYKKIVKIYTK